MNTILIFLFCILYIFFIFYWFFCLLFYIFNFKTELKPLNLELFDNYNFRGYTLFLFGQTIFKAYYLSFSVYYNCLKSFFIKQKKLDWRFVFFSIFLNYIIRVVTGFSKTVIIDSFNWSRKIILYKQNKINNFETFLILNINAELYKKFYYIMFNRIYQTKEVKFNFNPPKIKSNLSLLSEYINLPTTEIKNFLDTNVLTTYEQTKSNFLSASIKDPISKIAHQHCYVYIDKEKQQALTINETTKDRIIMGYTKPNEPYIHDLRKNIIYKKINLAMTKFECYFTDPILYHKDAIQIYDISSLTLAYQLRLTIKEPFLQAALFDGIVDKIIKQEKLYYVNKFDIETYSFPDVGTSGTSNSMLNFNDQFTPIINKAEQLRFDYKNYPEKLKWIENYFYLRSLEVFSPTEFNLIKDYYIEDKKLPLNFFTGKINLEEIE